MTATDERLPTVAPHRADKALALALRLAHAEHALLTLTSGQVDAIVNPSGQTYLLRPAQEQLRQSERRLRAIIESCADVITVVSRGGLILSQNQAARRVLGYDVSEMLGKLFFDFVHDDDLPAVHAAFLTVVEEFNEKATVTFSHRSLDGTWRPIEATVSKLQHGPSAAVIFNLRPASPLSRASREPAPGAVAPDKVVFDRDRFLAMLAHELRTPLSPVLLGISELEDDERFTEAKPTLSMLRRNIEVQTRLLEELSDFTSVGQHKVRLRLEAIDTHLHVLFVLEICKSELAKANIEILLQLRAEDYFVQADSVRLQQVLWNLVKNAIKFSTPGSVISITSANDTPGGLTLEVEDHGIGIEAALLPLVFDPLQQGDSSLQQLHGGLGLGLFIARGLAEAQGGTLTASSHGRGKGATFRLKLNTTPPQFAREREIFQDDAAEKISPVNPASATPA